MWKSSANPTGQPLSIASIFSVYIFLPTITKKKNNEIKAYADLTHGLLNNRALVNQKYSKKGLGMSPTTSPPNSPHGKSPCNCSA